MARIAKVVASLRFSGDDLEPSDLTHALGCEPTKQYRKGDVFLRDGRGRRPRGFWSIASGLPEDSSIDEHVRHLLGRVSSDPAVWKRLETYRPNIFFGLFMTFENEGDALAAETARTLAERGVALGFGIYAPVSDRSPD